MYHSEENRVFVEMGGALEPCLKYRPIDLFYFYFKNFVYIHKIQ